MLNRKVIASLLMTVVVNSQMASAEIAAHTATTNSYAAVTGAFADGSLATAASRPGLVSSVPLTDEMRSELMADGGLRSVAASYLHAPGSSHSVDGWLMLLVGGGLVVLQLRRKQKTLPQRPVIESDNKLFWG